MYGWSDAVSHVDRHSPQGGRNFPGQAQSAYLTYLWLLFLTTLPAPKPGVVEQGGCARCYPAARLHGCFQGDSQTVSRLFSDTMAGKTKKDQVGHIYWGGYEGERFVSLAKDTFKDTRPHIAENMETQRLAREGAWQLAGSVCRDQSNFCPNKGRKQ